jgi:hypothetical protein
MQTEAMVMKRDSINGGEVLINSECFFFSRLALLHKLQVTAV